MMMFQTKDLLGTVAKKGVEKHCDACSRTSQPTKACDDCTRHTYTCKTPSCLKRSCVGPSGGPTGCTDPVTGTECNGSASRVARSARVKALKAAVRKGKKR